MITLQFLDGASSILCDLGSVCLSVITDGLSSLIQCAVTPMRYAISVCCGRPTRLGDRLDRCSYCEYSEIQSRRSNPPWGPHDFPFCTAHANIHYA